MRSRRIGRVEQLELRLLMAANSEAVSRAARGFEIPGSSSMTSEFRDMGIIDEPSSGLFGDIHGNTYFYDALPAEIEPDEWTPQPLAADGGGEQANLTVPIYHSNSAAEKKIFLDFDGETVTNTSWNFNNNGDPIHAPAYSIDDEIFLFSEVELDRIFSIWERVSEDYSPFDVDVTTEDPGAQFFEDGGRGIRVLISTNNDDPRLGGTDNDWFSPAGGVGYVDSWNWRSDTPVWVFANLLGGGVKKVSEAAAHEVGHSLGLSHDGLQSGTSYFEGHGDWAPIMGNGYHREITQWSSGEYDKASNLENDLAIITNKIAYREDDHSNNPNEFSNPTPLESQGETWSASGIIERADDLDAFRFTVGPSASQVSLSFEPWHNSPNLNIQARLHAASGTILAESNPPETLTASIEKVLEPGEYFLAVTGVGEGDPSVDGYSEYASLGQFTIHGTVQGHRGDVNNDISVNADDIDALRFAIIAGSEEPLYDLNGDGIVSLVDVDELVYDILQTNYGDANLDGFVDASDFNIWNSNKFQVGLGWANGDFNGDFAIDSSDFNIWSVNRFSAGPLVAAASIVERNEFVKGSRDRSYAALSAVADRNADPSPTVVVAVPNQMDIIARTARFEAQQPSDSLVDPTYTSGHPFEVRRHLHRVRSLRRGLPLQPFVRSHRDLILVDAVFDRVGDSHSEI